MAVVKTTTTTYGQRVKNSFGGIGTGILMFIIGTIVLFWNEGRTVKTTRMLKGAAQVCVEADASQVNPEMEGKLVHMTAVASTCETLVDDMFPVKAEKAIKLRRDVEYYQWVEHEHSETHDKIGGGQETVTTYTYSKEWCSSPVNSGNFQTQYDEGHSVANKVYANIEDASYQAETVNFGAYTLDASLKGQIPCSEKVAKWYIDANGRREIADTVAIDPQIGDVRITFTKGTGGEASILAVATGSTFKKYYDAKQDKSLETLSMGNRTADEMFQTEHKANKTLGWILRIVGILFIVGGLKNIFKFIETLLKVLPFLANIIGAGVGLICWVIGLCWSFLIIAIGCLWYRPVLGVILLVAIGAAIYFLVKRGKAKKAEKDAAVPAE